MLEFAYNFLEDERANKLVQEYINHRLMKLLEAEMEKYNADGYVAIEEDDLSFSSKVEYLFPMSYPREKVCNTFLRLYALLQSEDTFPLELIMKYVMNQLIQYKVLYCQEKHLTTRERMPIERDYIVAKFQDEIDEEFEEPYYDEDLNMMSIFDAEREVDYFEDLTNYSDICFPAEDYSRLSFMTEEQILEKDAGKHRTVCFNGTHIEFVIPATWYY